MQPVLTIELALLIEGLQDALHRPALASQVEQQKLCVAGVREFIVELDPFLGGLNITRIDLFIVFSGLVQQLCLALELTHAALVSALLLLDAQADNQANKHEAFSLEMRGGPPADLLFGDRKLLGGVATADPAHLSHDHGFKYRTRIRHALAHDLDWIVYPVDGKHFGLEVEAGLL